MPTSLLTHTEMSAPSVQTVRISQDKALLRLWNNRNILIANWQHLLQEQSMLKWDEGGECVEPTWSFVSLVHRWALPIGCCPSPGEWEKGQTQCREWGQPRRDPILSRSFRGQQPQPHPPESGSQSGRSSFGPSSQKHTRKGMRIVWFLVY